MGNWWIYEYKERNGEKSSLKKKKRQHGTVGFEMLVNFIFYRFVFLGSLGDECYTLPFEMLTTAQLLYVYCVPLIQITLIR